MMRQVAAQILYQYAEACRLPFQLKSLDEEIRLEGTRLYQPEQTIFFVPEGFKKPYKVIFPELHKWVHQGLIDKSRIHDALVEVIHDFLTRWGPSFQQFEEYHRNFLYETCDRTIAKENSTLQADAGKRMSVGEIDVPHSDYRRSWLPDAILHTVEQNLRSFRAQPAAPGVHKAITC